MELYSLYNKYFFDTLGLFAERKKSLSLAVSGKRLRSQNEEISNSYIRATQQDLSDFLEYYFIFSQFQQNLDNKIFPFTFNFINDSSFEIKIDYTNSRESIISISVGVLFSLTDLMNRLCCNKDFMSFCPERDISIWDGTNCYWPHSHYIPRIRFNSYKTIFDERERPSDHRYSDDSMGKYLCGVPTGDEDRLYLANLLIFLCLSWMMFHEESHHWHGHLAYFFREKSEEHISETNGTKNITNKDMLKAFEFQADYKAAAELFDLVYNVHDSLSVELPDAFKYETDFCWSIRTLLVSIGSMILVMQRSQLIENTISYYPSKKTRLVQLLSTFINKAHHTFNEKGNFCGIRDVNTFTSKLSLGLLSGLYDLMQVEDILVDNSDQVDLVKRVFLEKNVPENLNFFNSQDIFVEILAGIYNDYNHSDEKVDKEWFAEYRKLSKYSQKLYDDIMPPYRNIVSSPY